MMNIIQQKEISMEIRILKRRALAIALIVICLAITAAGTLAFYTAEERAHNVITTGGVEIEVHEWANEDKTEPFPEDGVDDVTPGLSVTKIAEVENTGASAAWIRVLVETKVTAADGETELSAEPVSIDFNTENWTEGDDGWWYYNEALEPGETAEPLFTAVTFAPTMGNEYQESTCVIDVTAQAVQSANNGTSATDATGWPA